MTHTGGTVVTWPEPPTVPRFEWPVIVPVAVLPNVTVITLAQAGRRALRDGEEVWPAAVLVNSGTYVGAAKHAKPRESR
jgi:hypothetical protein